MAKTAKKAAPKKRAAKKTAENSNDRNEFTIENYRNAVVSERAQPRNEVWRYVDVENNGVMECHKIDITSLPKDILESIEGLE